jgi:hypothetical protein
VIEYRCRDCDEIHRGLPAWHFDAPLQMLGVPPAERTTRVALSQDDCVIDGEQFYLKGLLEIPVHGVAEPFVWGVWLSVSEESYVRYTELFDDVQRSAGESFFGWLCNRLPGYSDTQLLKTHLHVREYPMRPWVELEPTDHPLAVDQREGLPKVRALAMAQRLLHPSA